MKIISTSEQSPKSIKITWEPPARIEWKGTIESYVIVVTDVGSVSSKPVQYEIAVMPQSNNQDPSLATEPLQVESHTIDQLEENFEYTFSIFIMNTAGKSLSSNPVMMKMPQAGKLNMKCDY